MKKEYMIPEGIVFAGAAETLLQAATTGGTLEDVNNNVETTPEEGGMEADSKKFNLWSE